MLKQDLKKLYYKLYSNVYRRGKSWEPTSYPIFIPMRGVRYNSIDNIDKNGNNVRLMIVGRATNGWVELPANDEEDFADKAYQELEKLDRFSWVNDSKPYNINRSPFWNYSRTILNGLIVNQQLTEDFWYQNVAWNNLYLCAPKEGGNPSCDLQKDQLQVCKELLKCHIDYFDPTHILFITNEAWYSPFKDVLEIDLCDYNCDQYIVSTGTAIVKNHDTKIVLTNRPEYKKKSSFTEAVLDAFRK